MLTNQLLANVITRIVTTGVALKPTADSEPSLGSHVCAAVGGQRSDTHCRAELAELAEKLGADTLHEVEFVDVDDMLAKLRALAKRLP